MEGPKYNYDKIPQETDNWVIGDIEIDVDNQKEFSNIIVSRNDDENSQKMINAF